MKKTIKFHFNKVNLKKRVLVDQLFKDYKLCVNAELKRVLNNSIFFKDLFFNISRNFNSFNYFSACYGQIIWGKVVLLGYQYYQNVTKKMKFRNHYCNWIKKFDKLIYWLVLNNRKEFLQELYRLKKYYSNKDWYNYLNNNYKRIQFLVKGRFEESKLTIKIPEYKKDSIQLDQRVVRFEEAKSTSFDYWVKLSTSINKNWLRKGRKALVCIYLPIKISDYQKDKLNLAKSFVLQKDSYGNYSVNGVYEKKEEKGNITNKILGIDIGYKHLISVSNGYMSSKLLNKKLNSLDKTITNLRKNIQKLNSCLEKNNKKQIESKNLIRLEQRRRQLQKCFIGQEVNKLKKLTNKIIIENLNLPKKSYSKQFNRKINTYRYKFLINKLKENFKVTEINPAYTSQQCSNCNFISKKNRINQNKFQCIKCNYKRNADINASEIILKRFQDGMLLNNVSHDEVIEHLRRFYDNNQGSNNTPNILGKTSRIYRNIKSNFLEGRY